MRGRTPMLVAALCLLYAQLDQPRSRLQQHVGVVTDYEPGEWMAVDPDLESYSPIILTIRNRTKFEGNRLLLQPGVRVVVFYRSVAERRPVAERVRILAVDGKKT